MFTLRPDQTELKEAVYQRWHAGNRNVLGVLPTGGGKTVIAADIVRECALPTAAVAHRQELVGQISLALARSEIYHDILAPKQVIGAICRIHTRELGKRYHRTGSSVTVAGVDTLVKRVDKLNGWPTGIKLWFMDEAHHVLQKNKWGIAARIFSNACGLGLSATPKRADGNGLGADNDGVFHALVEGPTMRELITMGHLADYRIFGPRPSIDTSQIPISQATGDFNQNEVRKASHKSTITGDMVRDYLLHAQGKRGISFVVDVETAIETAHLYNNAGVKAEAISAKTPDHIRQNLIQAFRNNQITQLVNVDIFSEGFDCDAIEVVSDGAPTQSLPRYMQRFGRAVRIMDGKTHGFYIDHVNNVARHGLPDAPRVWSLSRRDRRGKRKDDPLKVRTCPECISVYEAYRVQCPYCGHKPVPEGRSAPEMVDGDLFEYSQELLAHMRGEIERIDGPALIPQTIHSPIVIAGIRKRHQARQEAQQQLRSCIAWWGGVQRDLHERDDSEAYRLFFHKFKVDVATAQALGRPEAEALQERILEDLDK